MTAENRDPSRLYGRASTFEGRRAVPSPEVRDRLAEQRERLMSKDSKVGKTHYEAEGVSGMDVTADDTAPCKCHKNFAHIAPTHSGHCCFVPATQTCHPNEVAAWVQRKENSRD